MRVLTVLGTRPEIIRLSRIIPLLDAGCDHVLVHTGQNTAKNLSDIFFTDLGVRAPDRHLGVDTSSLGRQLATLFEFFEKVLDEVKPDRVLLLGDTNSSLVAFVCNRRGVPVYHMEAGNRCFDDRVPEEVNRRVIDHCSKVLLPYTHGSAANLVREGIDESRIMVTGNPIFEVLQHYAGRIYSSDGLSRHKVKAGEYLLATVHRAENTDDSGVFADLGEALRRVAELYEMPLILSVHPRIEAKLGKDAFKGTRVIPIAAMPFFEFVKLQQEAALVLTDSGTVQEECCILHVPVITVRDTTERPETVDVGSNIVATTKPDAIVRAAKLLKPMGRPGVWDPPPEYLVPNVSETVVGIVLGA